MLILKAKSIQTKEMRSKEKSRKGQCPSSLITHKQWASWSVHVQGTGRYLELPATAMEHCSLGSSRLELLASESISVMFVILRRLGNPVKNKDRTKVINSWIRVLGMSLCQQADYDDDREGIRDAERKRGDMERWRELHLKRGIRST